MRRYFQILALGVLAFAAGGWGSIVAAALCPHARLDVAKTLVTESVTEERACHSVKPEAAAKPDCHDGSTMNQEEAGEAAPSSVMPGSLSRNATLSLPQNLPCTHCLGRPELPSSNLIARTQVEQRRGDETAALQPARPPLPSFSFLRPVLYRQGAPPGPNKPKHLLIGVLLI